MASLTNMQATLVSTFWPVVQSTIKNVMSEEEAAAVQAKAGKELAAIDSGLASDDDRKAMREELLAMFMVPALVAVRKNKTGEAPDVHSGGLAPKSMNAQFFDLALAIVRGVKATSDKKPKPGQHKMTHVEENLLGNCAKRLSRMLINMGLPPLDNRGAKRGEPKPRKEATPEQREKLAKMRAEKVKVTDRPSLYRYTIQTAASLMQLAIKHEALGGKAYRDLVEKFYQDLNKLPTN